MKRLVYLIIFLMISWIGSASAFEYNYSADDAKSKCPINSIYNLDKCMLCHTLPNFKLKEGKPDEGRVYPNDSMRVIGQKDGREVGYYLLEDISSDNIFDFFQYLSFHDIDYAVIELHSPGGSLLDAWRIVGIMQGWEGEKEGRVIETRCNGFAASAGFLIFITGTKGHRLAASTAEMMWHELSVQVMRVETPSSSEDTSLVYRHLQDTANEWVSRRGFMTKEEVDDLVAKKEFWLRGSEALEKGFVDRILGGR